MEVQNELDRRLQADVRATGAGAVAVLHGDVDVHADEALSDVYAQASAAHAAAITLDFNDVPYINSTGIALIVRLLGDARRDGVTVAAVGLSEHYRELFRITRLSDYLQIEENVS